MPIAERSDSIVTVLLALAVAVPVSLSAQRPPGETPPVDPAALDRSANACIDFYQFACGGWMRANPIPADQSRWNRFSELAERNRIVLLDILRKASEDRAGRTALEQKIGDYFATCLDESTADTKGPTPLAGELERIDALAQASELPAAIGRLHALGVDVPFAFGSEQDFKNATRTLAIADQSGLSLPDRDYYFKEDARSAEIRQKFVVHVERMLTLLGAAPEAAQASAKTVMELETELARISLDVVSRRDPTKLYHLTSRAELDALTPAFTWSSYFAAIQSPPVLELNVVAPEFFRGMNALIGSRPLAVWKTYLRWHLLRTNAALLSAPFVEESFAFNGRTLLGQEQQRSREKRCSDYVAQDLGEAIGPPYVEATFGPESKQRMLALVRALERALERDIAALPWMTDVTRKQAQIKLAAIRNKIGYPDTWRDYTALSIVRGDLVGNSWRANGFEFARQLAKIGKPLDRGEWGLTPATVNAGYNPLMNDITFPAAILQPPFFFHTADDAVNFGAIGAGIGHEITHGFDDSGRQFDADGNLRDWWSETDAAEFERRAECLVEQYSSYTAVDDLKLNGKLTLGENVADAGGLRIAYMALMDTLAGREPAPIEGFTPPQRFFLGFGQIWCENVRPETARMFAQVDPHSPGRHRVNGVVSNMPEFAEAFSCKAPTPMIRENRCRVW